MRKPFVFLVAALVLLGILVFAGIATAGHDDDDHTDNVHPMGHDETAASLFYGPNSVHTDMAMWGAYVFQGNWTGFRILDISAPGYPKLVTFEECNGNQGDVIVWDNILVRSWNSPASGTQSCDGQTVPAGFEGIHVFDVSDVADPVLVAAVETNCGSHTATGVPDLANDRLLVYNSSSGSACLGTEGLNIFRLSSEATASAIRLGHLNPQTQEMTLP